MKVLRLLLLISAFALPAAGSMAQASFDALADVTLQYDASPPTALLFALDYTTADLQASATAEPPGLASAFAAAWQDGSLPGGLRAGAHAVGSADPGGMASAEASAISTTLVITNLTGSPFAIPAGFFDIVWDVDVGASITGPDDWLTASAGIHVILNDVVVLPSYLESGFDIPAQASYRIRLEAFARGWVSAGVPAAPEPGAPALLVGAGIGASALLLRRRR